MNGVAAILFLLLWITTLAAWVDLGRRDGDRERQISTFQAERQALSFRLGEIESRVQNLEDHRK